MIYILVKLIITARSCTAISIWICTASESPFLGLVSNLNCFLTHFKACDLFLWLSCQCHTVLIKKFLLQKFPLLTQFGKWMCLILIWQSNGKEGLGPEGFWWGRFCIVSWVSTSSQAFHHQNKSHIRLFLDIC